MFFPGAHVLFQILLRTVVIYLLVLIGVRLSGKGEVGQMSPFDLTLLLLLSNSVQNAMTGPDTSLAGGMVAASTLLILNYLIAEVSGEPALSAIRSRAAFSACSRWKGHRVTHGSGACQHG